MKTGGGPIPSWLTLLFTSSLPTYVILIKLSEPTPIQNSTLLGSFSRPGKIQESKLNMY